MDIDVTFTDENGDEVGFLSVYKDGSDRENVAAMIEKIIAMYSGDDHVEMIARKPKV